MPVAHKFIAALLLVMPGGFVIGPLLVLWLRRHRRKAERLPGGAGAVPELPIEQSAA